MMATGAGGHMAKFTAGRRNRAVFVDTHHAPMNMNIRLIIYVIYSSCSLADTRRDS